MNPIKKLFCFFLGLSCLFAFPNAGWAKIEPFYPPDRGYLKDSQPIFAWYGGPAALEISRDGQFYQVGYNYKNVGQADQEEGWMSFSLPVALTDGQYFWRLRQGSEISPVFSFWLERTPENFVLAESYLEGPAPPYQAAELEGTWHLVYQSDTTAQIYYLTSSNDGRSFSQPQNLSRWPMVASSPVILTVDKDLAAGWLVEDGSASKLAFANKLIIQNDWQGPFFLNQPGQKIKSFSLTTLENKQKINIIYLAYAAEETNNREGIFLTSSADLGRSWLPPRRLGQAELDCKNPVLNSLDGRLGIFWTAKNRLDSEEIYCSFSRDGWLTWENPRPLTGLNSTAGRPQNLRQRIRRLEAAAGKDSFFLIWEQLAAFQEAEIKFLEFDPRQIDQSPRPQTIASRDTVLSSEVVIRPQSLGEKAELDLLSPPQAPSLWLETKDGAEKVMVAWQQIASDLTEQIYLSGAARQDNDWRWMSPQVISWPNFAGALRPVWAQSSRPFLLWASWRAGSLHLNFTDLAKWPFARPIRAPQQRVR